MPSFILNSVTLGTNISALWIITANGFMQNPVGYVIRNNRVELENFWEVLTNPYAWHMFFHTVVSCYIVGSFFVMAISAYHLLRKNEVPFFKKSFKFALALGIFGATLTPFIGHQSGVFASKMQPAKGAALETVWETQSEMPFHIIQIPDPENERNAFEAISIPKLGSFFYTNTFDGKVTGLKDIPKEDRPNVALTFYSFRLMVALGVFFMITTWYGFYLYKKNKLVESPRFLKMVLWSVLLPYIAINAGWMVAEVGRQPWTVYGLMRTAEAVSPITVPEVLFSMISLVAFYTVLLVADVYLIVKYAKKGPSKLIMEEEGGLSHVS